MTWDLFWRVYLGIAFVVFSLFFIFSGALGEYNAPLRRRLGYLDLFFLSTAIGLTWPYALVLLLIKGGTRE